MPELGVRLEDRLGPTCVKLEDKATLLREKEQKLAVEAAKQAVCHPKFLVLKLYITGERAKGCRSS